MLVELNSPPSYKESLLLAVISSEGFRNDTVTKQLTPQKFLFSDLEQRIQGIADPQARIDEVLRLAKVWKYHVESQAWAWYGELSRPGFRTFVWYNDDEIPVGVAIWSLPYPLRPNPSLLQRLWISVRQARAALNIAWVQLWYPGLNPRATSVAANYFHEIEDETHFTHTAEREQQLLAMSDEERQKTGYTIELSYYLRFFTVSDPGKGHGKRLFNAIQLNAQPFVLRNVRLEPKLTMIASPMGLPLYAKFGFRSIARVEREVNGLHVTRDLMVCP